MIAKMIEGCTRVLGKAQGYLGLPVLDCLITEAVNGPGTPAMKTSWEPTPAELRRLVAGAPVVVTIIGVQHPPIVVEVGDAPK